MKSNQAAAVQSPQFVGAQKSSTTPAPPNNLGKVAGLGLMAAGLLMLLGSLFDLGILWVLQRQGTPQWEYVAISNTLDSWPRIALGVGLIVGAIHLRGSASLLKYRLLMGSLVLLGLIAAGLGGMLVTSYLALARAVADPSAHLALQSVAIKAVLLSGLYFIVLVPFGLIGMRRPRG